MATTQTVQIIARADVPRSLDPRDPATPALADVARADVVMFEPGSSIRLELGDTISTASLERVIDGMSVLTITCLDPDGTLLRHRLLRRAGDGRFYGRTVLDSLAWHLVSVDVPAPRRVTLTFEEQAGNGMRRHDNPLAISRGKATRAQFIKTLCTEAGVDLVSPELNKRQPITAPSEDDVAIQARQTQAQRDRARKAGFPVGANLTVKGVNATPAQRENMAIVMGVAEELSAPPLAVLAAMVAGTAESNFTVVKNPHSRYAGVFQADPANVPADDTARQAYYFLKGGKGFQGGGAIALTEEHPDWTPGHIAYIVEGNASNFANADAAARFYDQHVPEAKRTITSYTGGEIEVPGSIEDTYAVPYEFTRGRDGQREDSWRCARRLADEVAWYFFICAGTAYYVSGTYLLRSRARMLVSPGETGIEQVTFKLDESPRRDDQVTVQCRASRWQAPPGSVVLVDGYGPADGRWLVGGIRRPKLFASQQTTVTLVQALRKKPEPAHEVRQRAEQADPTSLSGVDGTGLAISGGTIRDRVVAIAKQAAKLSADDPSYYRYSQAGSWKDDVLRRDKPTERSDCSAFVVQVYAKALGGYDKLPAAFRRQGYTGSLGSVGRRTETPKPGDICLYGPPPTYSHVELYVGGGDTIGHGDALVDESTPRGRAGFAGYWTFDFLDD